MARTIRIKKTVTVATEGSTITTSITTNIITMATTEICGTARHQVALAQEEGVV